jgi:hypothetical protein
VKKEHYKNSASSFIKKPFWALNTADSIGGLLTSQRLADIFKTCSGSLYCRFIAYLPLHSSLSTVLWHFISFLSLTVEVFKLFQTSGQSRNCLTIRRMQDNA